MPPLPPPPPPDAAQVVVTEEAPVIDGVIDEAAWQQAPPVTTFRRYLPNPGGEPVGTTEVRFLQDDRNLYVAARIRGADYPIRARVSPREEINADDQIGLYLDTFRDQRTGYIFYHNAIGIQQDIRVGPGFGSMAWDTVFRSKGRVVDGGYDLELAIPWRSLKYPRSTVEDDEQTWGLILTRKIPSEGAKYSFPLTERGHPRLFTQAAPLVGVRPAPNGSGFDIQPALTAFQRGQRPTPADGEPAEPMQWTGFDPWFEAIRPSLDVRFGLTESLGLTASINPDFSQVEVDQTFVDLNARFAFFFTERRPFFLDGADAYADQMGSLYSRSIVAPLEGVKLTGRAGPWSIGVLHALDRTPAPTVNENPTPGFQADDVATADGRSKVWGLNDLVRLKLDAFGEGYIGATLVDKRLLAVEGGGLTASHTGAGLDVRVPFAERWTVDAHTLHTLTGPAGQAPDWGMENRLRVERAGGQGWGGGVQVLDRTAGLRKEMGFLNQAALTTYDAWLDHTYTWEQGAFDAVIPRFGVYGIQERNGDAQRRVQGGLNLQHGGVHNWDMYGGWLSIEEEGVQLWDGWQAGLGYSADLTSWLTVGPVINVARTLDFGDLAPSFNLVGTVNATFRPTAGIRLDSTFQVRELDTDGQAPDTATFFRNRLTWQFTPKLGTRLVVEHTDGTVRDPQLITNLLVTWLEHPGTAFYVGYLERTDLSGDWLALDRQVFFKASVLWRP